MKVLMLGWELPPIYAGGIGMVCYDLLKELSTHDDVEVTYVMPFGPQDFTSETGARVLIAEQEVSGLKNVKIKAIKSLLHAYSTPEEYDEAYKNFIKKGKSSGKRKLYGKDLFAEVDLFAKRVWHLAQEEDFDVIHAHDWMTFPAAIAAKDASGKPLAVHIHNTIYDRYLGNASQHERDIEYNGMARADRVITVSQYIKDKVIEKYSISPEKVTVIHNAPSSLHRAQKTIQTKNIDLGENKVVLFAGRITIQKGPEYFVQCAKEVLKKREDVRFIVAGTGDMLARTVDLAADLGVADKFIFTGKQFTVDEARALYARADCFIMPSVSEPFGIVPFEAMDLGTPTIVSKSSGCCEVLSHVFKCDFWDSHRMANQVLGILNYPVLQHTMGENGQQQVAHMDWSKPASECKSVYYNLQRGS